MTLTAAVLLSACLSPAEGAKVITYYGYDDCVELTNGSTRVVLCPGAGGRVLEYSQAGVNALYLNDGRQGYRWHPNQSVRATMSAGRFDIGPEQLVPRRDALWKGPWTAKITGPRSARLTSVKDAATGVQLTRDFRLAGDSSRLDVSQTIHNVSDEPKEYCHWSRTFAVGGGTVVIPKSERSRFPSHYVMYESSKTMNFRPEDSNIQVHDTHLAITAAPQFPKLGMDSQAGWFAYLMPHNTMFVKTFRVDPSRSYNEVAGLTVSIWYPKDRGMVELEPIGPAEKLQPGESGTFTETWWLLPQKFPGDPRAIDFRAIEQAVQSATAEP